MLPLPVGLLAITAAAWAGERVLWTGDGPLHLGAPSPDGHFISGVEKSTGALILREAATGAIRNVTGQPASSGEFAYFSVISRDGKHIAYAWFNRDGFYDLRVVRTNGGEPRVLYANEEAGFVQPCAWSPDGKSILALLFRADNVSQIALIPAAGGTPRVLKTLNWVYPNKMDLSPDGKFIVYDNFSREGASERDIFAMAVDGSREARLVGGSSNDVFPVFQPDGEAVVFLSDRTGQTGIWRQPFPSGVPRLLKDDVGRALALGITGDGVYHYARRSGGTDVLVVEADWKAGKLKTEPHWVSGGTASGNSLPVWSPDGALLAWLSRIGTENFGQDSRAITLSDGRDVRMLAPRLAHLDRLKWAADGSALLVEGADRHGRRGLFEVDLASGEATPAREVPLGAAHDEKVAVHEEGRVYVCGRNGSDRRLLATVRNGEIDTLEWFPDGSALLMGTTGRTRRLWRVGLEGAAPQPLELAIDRTGPASVNPADGRLAYTAGSEWTEVRALRLAPD